MADALENARSENTRRNYAGQYRKFRAWCEREGLSRAGQSALPVQPEIVAAYAAELAEDGNSMSTVRLAVAAVADAHRQVGLESPQTAGISETPRGLSQQLGVSQKQAKPLDADALAAIGSVTWYALSQPFSERTYIVRRHTAYRNGTGTLRRQEIGSVFWKWDPTRRLMSWSHRPCPIWHCRLQRLELRYRLP